MLNEKIFLLLGYILFCAGVMLGIPHGKSKGRGDPAHTELWRVAHLSTCIGGISIISLEYALKSILPDVWIYALATYSIASYFFAIACTLSGATNVKWYGNRKKVVSKVIYCLHFIAAILSIIAVIGTLISLFFDFPT